jgi:hypothetical protein
MALPLNNSPDWKGLPAKNALAHFASDEEKTSYKIVTRLMAAFIERRVFKKIRDMVAAFPGRPDETKICNCGSI